MFMQKQNLMESAIDTMTTAIGLIVSHSTNGEFLHRLFSRTQVLVVFGSSIFFITRNNSGS